MSLNLSETFMHILFTLGNEFDANRIRRFHFTELFGLSLATNSRLRRTNLDLDLD